MITRRTLFAATAIAASVLASAAVSLKADDDNDHGNHKNRFRADLAGFHETTAVSTTGEADLSLKINDKDQTIEFKLSYEGLTGDPGAAHVHFGERHSNGGVIFFFCGGGSKPACPPQPATITGTVVATDILGPATQGIAAGEFAEAVAAIRAEATYANIHTAAFPGGEIRGQVH